jgi:hypothetical protein
MIVDI